MTLLQADCELAWSKNNASN